MIEVKDLDFQYGDGEFRMRIPHLAVEPGATAAIIGPSGTGKTTLLNLLSGVLVPAAGRIEANGVDVPRLSDRARRNFRIVNIGMVFQEFELLSYLKVLDNILLPYRINPALRLGPVVVDKAVNLAASVGIGDKLKRHPDKLSQGERQRVAVCRALLTDPAIILADEPTGNLDPSNKDRVLDILFEYANRRNATMVTVTHDRDLLGRFDRVIDFKQFYRGPDLATGRPAIRGRAES
jgi:putative ABC transport system ATP-binding protein